MKSAQAIHILVHRRIKRVIQDVEGALDASARLGEIELAQVWEPPAHLAERAGNERVLDDAAHVVVDVQAERVGLGVRLGEL
ncbi:MAG: hypothetical protein WBP81_17665, partial [Solirubrobacteraceae bacterium]